MSGLCCARIGFSRRVQDTLRSVPPPPRWVACFDTRLPRYLWRGLPILGTPLMGVLWMWSPHIHSGGGGGESVFLPGLWCRRHFPGRGAGGAECVCDLCGPDRLVGTRSDICLCVDPVYAPLTLQGLRHVFLPCLVWLGVGLRTVFSVVPGGITLWGCMSLNVIFKDATGGVSTLLPLSEKG